MKCNPKHLEELCQHTLGVIDLDQDIIIARSTMELWVGLKNISPYFAWVYDTTVADFQVLVRCDLQVLGQSNSQVINFNRT